MDKIIEQIKSLRDDALRNYALSERGIATLKEMEDAEEDIIANYYELRKQNDEMIDSIIHSLQGLKKDLNSSTQKALINGLEDEKGE